MTAALKQLLDTFDALTDAEKQEAATAILRRVFDEVPAELPDEALVAAAEELFLDLDARESSDAQS